MQDKTRLAITGAVALVAVIATVGGSHGFNFTFGDDGDDGGKASEEIARVLPNLKNFDGVALVGPDDVIVTQGRDFAVKVEGDAELLDRMDIFVKDGTLQVGRKSSFISHGGGNATIRVTLPALSHVTLTGPGDMTVDKLAAKQVKAELTGPGSLSIAALEADDAVLALTGPGDLIVGGKAVTASLSSTGPGNIDADKLAVETAKLDLIGTGDIGVRATKGADISIMGTGNARVRGTASCKVTKLGTGDAECIAG